jgi:streptomycin 6-kinase
MRPSHLGSSADQDLRLLTEPAELFVVQFNGRIDSSVVQRVRITADYHARARGKTLLAFIDGTDTARILKAYGKADSPSADS